MPTDFGVRGLPELIAGLDRHQAGTLANAHRSRVERARKAHEHMLADWLDVLGWLFRERSLIAAGDDLGDACDDLDLADLLHQQSPPALDALLAFYENGAKNTRSIPPMRAVCTHLVDAIKAEQSVRQQASP